MSTPNSHLPGIESAFMRTSRLRMHILSSGPVQGYPVLFLHGNLATSTFWEETMLSLPPQFRSVRAGHARIWLDRFCGGQRRHARFRRLGQ